jgi:hypothetical protein
MLDMINPQNGIDLINNNSIINRILFAVTIFQQKISVISCFLGMYHEELHVSLPLAEFVEPM